jgi:CHAD domain-containing protein
MDAGYRILAAKYVRRQAKQLVEQFDGLRAAEDIEFVHRARVATRRLRAALGMFGECFPSEQLRQWRKAIRRTTAKLGDARDRDVQIEFLCGILSALNAKDCFPGICRVLVQLERDRERLQRKVVKAVDRLEAKGVLRQVRQVSKTLVPETADSAANVQTPDAYAQTRRHIVEQLDELFSHQDSLANLDDCERHHAMRIAAKRLRYTLEIARPVYRGRLDEAIEATKRVQSLLGDVHDCDVWAEDLEAFASQQRDRLINLFGHAGRFARLQPGIDYLRQDRRDHRQAVFGELVAYWDELGRRQFWEGLRGAVLAHGQPSEAIATEPVVAGLAVAVPKSASTGDTMRDPAVASETPRDNEKVKTRPRMEALGRVRPVARKSLLTAGP